MDKLKKYLMLLLVATLSLTFTACGGDDEDEPKLPDSSFLYGTWDCPYQRVGEDHYRGNTMTFSSDGSFNASITEKSYVLKGEYLGIFRK